MKPNLSPVDMSDRGVSALRKHEEFYIRDGNICILVEDTIFRLHKSFFERESEYFRERFKSSGEAGADWSLQNPYKIHDVTSDEFAQLVWVWYNPRYSFSKQTKQKWLTILRLATMWGFHDVRQLSIRQLERMQLEPIEKITTYKQYSVENELLLPSYVSLCRSPKLPSPEEGERLTLDTVLRLATAREQVVLRASELGCKTPSTAEAPDDLVREIVAQQFALSLPPSAANSPVDSSVVTVKEPSPDKNLKPHPDEQRKNGLSTNGTSATIGKGKRRAGTSSAEDAVVER